MVIWNYAEESSIIKLFMKLLHKYKNEMCKRLYFNVISFMKRFVIGILHPWRVTKLILSWFDFSGVKHGYESTSTKENVDKKSSEEFKRSVPSSLTEDCSSVPKPSMSKQDFDQPTTSMKDDHFCKKFVHVWSGRYLPKLFLI